MSKQQNNVNQCVICGQEMPEGNHVCVMCQNNMKSLGLESRKSLRNRYIELCKRFSSAPASQKHLFCVKYKDTEYYPIAFMMKFINGESIDVARMRACYLNYVIEVKICDIDMD